MEPSNAENQTTAIFLHNMKTGGSTMRKLLQRIYHREAKLLINLDRRPGNPGGYTFEEYCNLPASEKLKLKVVEGHMPYHLSYHRHLPQKSLYITILRNPVERLISFYYWMQDYEPKWCALFTGFEDFIVRDFPRKNEQTRSLSSFPVLHESYDSAESLQSAKYNLEHKIDAFGLTEKFDQTLIIFKHLLNWEPYPLYRKENVTKKRPRKSELPQSTIELIEEHNRNDVELYKFAVELFEKRLEKMERSFWEEVGELKRLNHIYRSSDSEIIYECSRLNAEGEALFNAGKIDKAEDCFLKTASLNPNDIPALNNLGVVYFNQGERAKSLEYFRKVLQIDSHNRNAVFNLAEAHKHLGRKDDARAFYNEYLDHHPQDAEFAQLLEAL